MIPVQMTAVRKKIKQRQLAPIYVLYGIEDFLIEEMKQMIIKQSVERETFEFNFAQFDMAETPVETAVEDADVLPFIGEYRVVVIKNPIFLTGKKDKNKIEHDLKKLEQYIDHPSPHSIMIFHADYEKLDQRKKVVKKLKKVGEVVEFSSANEAMIYEILRERAEKEGAVFTKEANERLLQMIGPHLYHLTSEVDKMALYAGEKGEINADVVDLLTSRTLESNVFALIDKVVHDRLDEGFSILRDLIKQKEEPIRLLALLARQFRIIYQVKESGREGNMQAVISKRLKLHPYAVKVASGQAKSFESTELLRILNECAKADFAMKTGQMDKRLALELLLTKFQSNKKTTPD